MFISTRSYINWQLALWDARRMCEGQPTLIDAVKSLSVLNPVAKDENTDYRFAIYRLKTHLIRVLYQAGLAESVSLKIQRLVCRACHGRGEFYSGVCHRCWGTGIHKEISLYEFVFRFGGRVFIWHQPEYQVVYPLALTTAEVGTYRAPSYASLNYTQPEMLAHIAVLFLYLVSAGVEPTDLPAISLPLRACVQLDLQMLRGSINFYAHRLFSFCEFCHRPEFILGREVGNHSQCFPF